MSLNLDIDRSISYQVQWLFPGILSTLRKVSDTLQLFSKMNTVKISVCVSPEERQVIKAQAASAGLSLSQYMGTIALCSRLDHPSVLQSLYLKAGEAHTLAHLVLTKYGNPSENSVEDINADFADLIQVIAGIHALTKELID